MERIFPEPHVFAAGCDRIRPLCHVVFRRTGVLYGAHIAMSFKNADGLAVQLGNLLCPNGSPHGERDCNNASYCEDVKNDRRPSGKVLPSHGPHLLHTVAKREIMPPLCSCQFVPRPGLSTVPTCTSPAHSCDRARSTGCSTRSVILFPAFPFS